MNLLRESINKSKKWKYNRDFFQNNKLLYTIKEGLIKWHEIEPDVFLYSEIIFNNKRKTITNFKFVFKGKTYKVYKDNGDLFYVSSNNNKAKNIIEDKMYDISFDLIKNNNFLMKINVYDNKIPNVIITVKTNYLF
jgi:hypothetical protein